MPTDTIPSSLHSSGVLIEHQVGQAKSTTQGGSDVWCVIAFDDVYMGTVWSQPRTFGGPTNHAEDRFFGEYSLNMISDFIDKFGRFPEVLTLILKYSPCNKRNDDRQDRCTFKIKNDKSFWVSIRVYYDRSYTGKGHMMSGSETDLNDGSKIIMEKW